MPDHEAITLTLPTFIPISEAARKYDLAVSLLTRLIQNGKLEAARLPSGDILVSDNGRDLSQIKTKEQLVEEKFGYLRFAPITVSEAAAKYRVPNTTLREWIAHRYVTVVDEAYPIRVDQAEVAYCAEIYHRRQSMGIRSGVPLLDDDGLAYQLKHPDLSQYRRRRQQSLRRN